jgi:hypothetical protein
MTSKKIEWKNIIENDNLSPNERMQKMKSQLKKLDSQTRSYEILTGISNSVVNSQNLNESYLDAIKAKLAYIGELSAL